MNHKHWQSGSENDNERTTHHDIRNLITELQLSPNILSLFDGNCTNQIMKDYHFDKDYQDPWAILNLKKTQQDTYLIHRYKPILAYTYSKIFAYDSKLNGYTSYYIEEKMTEAQHCFTWDGIFITEILRWWEYEISDQDIINIGNFFGLKHTLEILDSINETTKGEGFSTQPEIDDWKNRMITAINGKIQ